MERAVIIYASTHHGNTRKLAEGISQRTGMGLIDASVQKRADLSGYALIGFASGIDFGTFYPSVIQFLKENLPPQKKVFFLYTCARTGSRFTEEIRREAAKKNAVLLGEYGCRGYNTYGPWKLIGGMNKGHPTEKEIQGAVEFVEARMEA